MFANVASDFNSLWAKVEGHCQLRVIGSLVMLVWFGAVFQTASADVLSRDPASAELHALFDAAWESDMRESPVWASMLGDRRFNRSWSDLSNEGQARRSAADARFLKGLERIDQELLSPDDLRNYALFAQEYQDRLAESAFHQERIPISQRGGIQTLDETGNRLRMETVRDFEDWLARLAKLDGYMSQTIALMETGIRSGHVPPKVTMQRVPGQIQKQLVDTPENSLFYAPFSKFPEHFSEQEKQRLQAEAKEVIKTVVVPAYRRLDTFFNETYLPACRDDIAASNLPDGRAFYEHRVKRYTTTDMTPNEVHDIGLKEVKRIRAEMREVMRSVEFEGDLQAFFTFLREDPQFYFSDPSDLLTAYEATSKQIDPKLVQLFTKLPRMPYGIAVIPESIAPDTTTAYYTRPAADGSRPGYYWVNLYNPMARPKFEIEVLSVHEAVPGHHLQIALQQELEGLPNFRRYSGFTVFTEGWGLYSERLGYDIGLYQDPYSRFGQLSYDMWRAVRLVVDTGMHYKGWSRDRAIAYFEENAPRKKLDIVNEIDRYISWPGQALAYKIGQLKMSELRARANAALGENFDLRRFHDRMLSNGAIPLSLLEAEISAWIDDEQRRLSDL